MQTPKETSIEYCLILSAGLGTRMGKIGQLLPKILWPIFEKRIIELQISYALGLGVKKIFINTHFQAEHIKDFIDHLSCDNIHLVHEPDLLGTGGAIHNVASLIDINPNSRLLVLNGDQFLYFDKKNIYDAIIASKEHTATLFAISLDTNSGYNETIVNQNKLVGIQKSISSSSEQPITFSGTSIINLHKLVHKAGHSSFFDSVAKYKEEEVYVITPSNYEYWDFGTTSRYFDSMFKLLGSIDSNADPDSFLTFCIRNEVFNKNKISHKESSKITYNTAHEEESINLSHRDINNPQHKKVIILQSNSQTKICGNGIYYDDLFEKI